MPAIIIVTIPKTRWWTWTPLSVTMLPGHHGTLGLRISRVLMRMNANEPTNPSKHEEQPLTVVGDELVVPEVGDE